jgi:hypothetical protein
MREIKRILKREAVFKRREMLKNYKIEEEKEIFLYFSK